MTSTNAMLAKIHIAKAELGLDDELYRDTLASLTGKTSARLCSSQELETVLKHFQKAGFKPKGKAFNSYRSDGPSTKYAAKIHALWISGWNLGVIRDNSDHAMESFIARQTGVAKAQWLKDPKDAAKVIDALKAWLTREAGVAWTYFDKGRTQRHDPGEAVILAQVKLLKARGLDLDLNDIDFNTQTQQAFGRVIRKAEEAA